MWEKLDRCLEKIRIISYLRQISKFLDKSGKILENHEKSWKIRKNPEKSEKNPRKLRKPNTPKNH